MISLRDMIISLLYDALFLGCFWEANENLGNWESVKNIATVNNKNTGMKSCSLSICDSSF